MGPRRTCLTWRRQGSIIRVGHTPAPHVVVAVPYRPATTGDPELHRATHTPTGRIGPAPVGDAPRVTRTNLEPTRVDKPHRPIPLRLLPPALGGQVRAACGRSSAKAVVQPEGEMP